MNEITEIRRFRAPAPRPQSLAFDGKYLWMGSIETCCLYALEPKDWNVVEEAPAPGFPWGMTAANGELRVLCGEGNEDDRFVRSYVPGRGFGERIACPDNTGSQLGFDGKFVYISQWYKKRILAIDDSGAVLSIIDVPHGICGQVNVDGFFYLVTTDDEASTNYWLTRVDANTGHSEDIARIPFHARALAFDGSHFWTNDRERGLMVSFARP
jgi:hypothetical protein